MTQFFNIFLFSYRSVAKVFMRFWNFQISIIPRIVMEHFKIAFVLIVYSTVILYAFAATALLMYAHLPYFHPAYVIVSALMAITYQLPIIINNFIILVPADYTADQVLRYSLRSYFIIHWNYFGTLLVLVLGLCVAVGISVWSALRGLKSASIWDRWLARGILMVHGALLVYALIYGISPFIVDLYYSDDWAVTIVNHLWSTLNPLIEDAKALERASK